VHCLNRTRLPEAVQFAAGMAFETYTGVRLRLIDASLGAALPLATETRGDSTVGEWSIMDGWPQGIFYAIC
jgi:hypothetical protein